MSTKAAVRAPLTARAATVRVDGESFTEGGNEVVTVSVQRGPWTLTLRLDADNLTIHQVERHGPPQHWVAP